MKCKHELQHLVGTENGIKCRNCGKQFPDFAAIKADIEAQKDDEKDVKKDEIENVPKIDSETAIPEKDGVADKDIKKQKKTAVPAKSSTDKGSKTTKKKTVSEK